MWLKGKAALVTGSSRGIGRGIAIKLADYGAGKICVNYVSQEDAANKTLAAIRDHGADGFICQADVSKPGDIRRMFSEIKSQFGSVDVLVSNARSELPRFYAPPLEIGLEQFEHAFDSQVRAFHLCVRAMVDLLDEGQEGRIVEISYSPSGRTGSWQPWVAMGSAKAAADSLARYYAVALAPRGITVNIVSPGATDDSVLSGLPQEVFDSIRDFHEGGWTPMRRLGTPADIGNAVTLLCTKRAGFITGQTIHVDGGASVMDPVFPLAVQGIE